MQTNPRPKLGVLGIFAVIRKKYVLDMTYSIAVDSITKIIRYWEKMNYAVTLIWPFSFTTLLQEGAIVMASGEEDIWPST